MIQQEHPPKPTPKRPQSVAFHTLGCRTNQLETSTLADDFRARGWQIHPFGEPASVYVINTCTVTERADTEAQRVIRRAQLSNPEATIVVTGCYAQVAPQEVAALSGVNYVFGNQWKSQIPEIIAASEAKPEATVMLVSDIDKSRVMHGSSAAGLNEDGEGRTRASLKIQDGCDYKCTYCIIWEARGQSRSLPVDDLKHQLESLIAEGYHEISLCGINIGQYQYENYDLASLLNVLSMVPGDFRLRLTSLDPLEVTPALIDIFVRHREKIAPHLHLSTQSADDTVLKRMARRHHVCDLVEICETTAREIPNITITSDIIVGFPGETDSQFENTVRVLSQIPMHAFHVFSYSKRRGTPAAAMPDQVPERVKKERANRLKALSDEKYSAYLQSMLGQTLNLIAESPSEKAGQARQQRGMSEYYIRPLIMQQNRPVLVPPNTRIRATITQVVGTQCWAEPEHIITNSERHDERVLTY
ncbi:MAG: tRNA (N(6)-L-threonylcarbamoyladenosine(37)-C(2))-methylthiotransferase MtaB [Cyanobacteria bacterium]|nr:tRNA (N(6)-L-threonylcarbamoyladenosine(37)-C(2))-methylthiotransferase MtaB [Cyanobacteriota bacterium]